MSKMFRRGLMSGAAAVAAFGSLPQGARAAATLPPGPTLGQFSLLGRKVPASFQPIGFRSRGIPGGGSVYDSTNTHFSDRQIWQAPSWCSVTSIRLVYSCFDIYQYGEIDRVETPTISASLFTNNQSANFPAASATAAAGATAVSFLPQAAAFDVGMTFSQSGNTTAGTFITSIVPVYNTVGLMTSVTVNINQPLIGAGIANGSNVALNFLTVPVTFGGKTSIAVPSSRAFLISDPIGLYLTPGQQFWSNTDVVWNAAGVVLQDVQGIFVASEGCTRGVAASNLFNPAVPTHTGGGFWGPVGVLADLPTPRASLLVCGDSISAGNGDTSAADTNARVGYMQRCLGNNMPFFSVAMQGQAALYNVKRFAGLQAAFGIAKFTDVLVGYCRNDIAAGQSAATTKANVALFAAPFMAAGARIWVVTALPSATSTNSWADLANQTISNPGGGEAQRLVYNTDIRANWASYGYAGLIDIAGIIESVTAPGKFNPGFTNDGVHPSTAGVNAIVAAAILTPAMFTLP